MKEKRVIKFRALREHTAVMEYGFYFADSKGHYIVDDEGVESIINPDTLGQFTGLLDKNKKEIYEGDIVDCITNCITINHIRYPHRGVIRFINSYFAIEVPEFYREDGGLGYTPMMYNHEFEVIGDIYTTPELLKSLKE